MDDNDDEIDGLSPTSMWRRNRKRKDFSDEEDYKPDEEEVYKPEEEEDRKPVDKGIDNRAHQLKYP
jgi:hypothetical protein